MSEEPEEKEIDKLRKTIEEFRIKAERSGNAVKEDKTQTSPTLQETNNDSGIWNSPPSYPPPALPSGRHYSNLDVKASSSAINNRVSSGSISSMSSHASHSSMSSTSSGGSIDSELKQKKKRWLPLKTFTKPTRSNQNLHSESSDRDEATCLHSPTLASKNYFTSNLTLDPRSYSDVQILLQEKDRKLTDSKLEALTLQHQLHQLQDQIAQMQHEMQLLRNENDRLRVICDQTDDKNFHDENPTKYSFTALSSGYDKDPFEDATSNQQLYLGLKSFDSFKLRRLMSPESEDDGLQMRFTVQCLPLLTDLNNRASSEKITIASIPVSRKTIWEELDKKTFDIFLEYCQCIDGDQKLGLSNSSISFYKVGEQTRVPGTNPPELLPCAFIVGNVDSVDINLKDASCGTVDLMSFKTLIPKEVLSNYIKILTRKRRLILYGPSGTGKTMLAHSLANHVVMRERLNKKENSIFIYDVKKNGEEELKNQIASFATGNTKNPQTFPPRVIIVENCYLLTSVQNTFLPLITQSKMADSPFIIGIMLQSKTDIMTKESEFEWISCSTSSIHVKNYLARQLRRSMIESVIGGAITCEDDFQNILRVVTWLPLCWHHVNRCLENNNAADVTIGPRVFTFCPNDFYSSCSWFVQVWNYVMAPYITVAIQKVRQSHTKSNWNDPTNWVVENFPWNQSDMGCDNSLRLKRIAIDDLNAHPGMSKPSTTSTNFDSAEAKSGLFCSKTLHTSSVSREADMQMKSERQFNIEGDKDTPLRPMQLIETRDEKESVAIWQKHNNTLTLHTREKNQIK